MIDEAQTAREKGCAKQMLPAFADAVSAQARPA